MSTPDAEQRKRDGQCGPAGERGLDPGARLQEERRLVLLDIEGHRRPAALR
jgi:hypothetical protein